MKKMKLRFIHLEFSDESHSKMLKNGGGVFIEFPVRNSKIYMESRK